MSFSKSILSAAAIALMVGTPAFAAEHHHHLEQRAMVTQFVYQTILVDQDGNPITENKVATTPPAPATSDATPSTTTTPESSSSAPAVTEANKNAEETSASLTYAPTTTSSSSSSSTSSSSSSSSTSSSSSSSSSTSSSAPSSTGSSSGGILGDLSYEETPNTFEDGTIDCSDFPEGNGVIGLNWLGHGGWSGIQFASGDDTRSGDSCTEGAFCSYACQPGMSKTQWPSSQPSNGVSIGGLKCKNGKLYRTNSDEDTLCKWGVGSAVVKSELSKDVAICRTDYPGTENMVLPTVAKAGSEVPLTVVNEHSYYRWQGGLTSAQYYANNAGVSVEDGCTWSTSGSGKGNWAPINFGAGMTGGKSWLALIPNPNNRSPANYNVKIVGTEGSNVIGKCVYENGKFNGGDDGCTVTVSSGQAQYVLYN